MSGAVASTATAPLLVLALEMTISFENPAASSATTFEDESETPGSGHFNGPSPVERLNLDTPASPAIDRSKRELPTFENEGSTDYENAEVGWGLSSNDATCFDSDDEEEVVMILSSGFIVRRMGACSSRTRLKKVKKLSLGVDFDKTSCCNKRGTSLDVYTIDGDSHLAGLSCGMDTQHRLRRGVYRVISSVYAERFVLMCIAVQTVALALAIPGNISGMEEFQKVIARLNGFFLGVYTLEMLLRVVALGFIRGRFSYLRNVWNILDFFLVLAAWMVVVIDALGEDGNIVNPSLLRVLRCLRPLRTAGFVTSVTAALSYWRHLLTIAAFMLFALALFGVMGIQMFGGALSQECTPWADNTMQCSEALVCESEQCTMVANVEQIWGFDNIAQAITTGWIITTGDGWNMDMMRTIMSKQIYHSKLCWAFFLVVFISLHLVVSNLFVAVIVESFVKSQVTAQDAKHAKQSVRKVRSIFDRLDEEGDGRIATAELRRLAFNLGLTDTAQRKSQVSVSVQFADHELAAAMREMDADGDGSVDFEEFKAYWDGNSSFVIKLKKALARQEQMIRQVWTRVDQDGSECLDAHEVSQLASILGIHFDASMVKIAVSEMGGDIPIPYENFVAWWLSDSALAEKVRAAKQSDDGVAHQMYTTLLGGNPSGVEIADLLSSRGKQVFGKVLSRGEAAEILNECTEDSPKDQQNLISLVELRAWWNSSKPVAQHYRQERQMQLKRVRDVLVDFDVRKGSDLSTDERLDDEELRLLIKKLNIGKSLATKAATVATGKSQDGIDPVDKRLESLKSQVIGVGRRLMCLKLTAAWNLVLQARDPTSPTFSSPGGPPSPSSLQSPRDGSMQQCSFEQLVNIVDALGFHGTDEEIIAMMQAAANDEEADTEMLTFDQLQSFFLSPTREPTKRRILEVMKANYRKHSIEFDDFFNWLTMDTSGLARSTAGAIEAYSRKKELQASRHFPWIPGVSSCLRSVIVHQRFDDVVLVAILFNTAVMMITHHEMEISRPTLSVLVHYSEAFFSGLFALECAVKILASGFLPYWSHGENKFDFLVTASFVAGIFLPSGAGVGALRGLRILVKLLRVARAAKVLVKNDAVAMLVKTVTQSSGTIITLAGFGIFMLVLFSIVGGHTLGRCHDRSDASVHDADIPLINFYSFGAAMHANFLITMSQAWSGVMNEYATCSGSYYWVYFTVVYAVMAFLIKNLFVAVIVENFCFSEAEKMVKQQVNYFNNVEDKAKTRTAAAYFELKLDSAEDEQSVGGAFAGTAMLAGLATDSLGLRSKENDPMEKIERDMRRRVHIQGNFDVEGLQKALESSPEEVLRTKAASLGCFTMDSPSRKKAISIVDDPRFESVVLVFIYASSVLMALEGPPNAEYLQGKPDLILYLHIGNIVVLVAFWIEAIMRIIADGLITTPSAYLKSKWNVMDFVVVIFATLDVVIAIVLENLQATASEELLQSVRILRILRVLRPLRAMRNNESMAALIEALSNCMPVLIGAFFLSLLFYLSFAIFGVSLFMGKFYSCNCEGNWDLPFTNCTEPDYRQLDRDSCLSQGGTWENPPYNFDNFLNAMQSLFYCSTPGSWEVILQSGMDVTEVYEAPKRDNEWHNFVFFQIFVVIENAFVKNIFVGLLTNYFLAANGAALITHSQGIWAQAKIRCLFLDPYDAPKPKKGTFKRNLFDVINLPIFEPVVAIAIILNVVALGAETIPKDEELAPTLHIVNVSCLTVFSADVLIRMYALGAPQYLRDRWNALDSLIVVTAWLSTYADQLPPGFAVLRALRLFRAMMLLRRSRFLRPLMRTLVMALPACLNVMVLVFMCIFIYAVLTMQLYGGLPHTKHNNCLSDIDNFDDFWNASAFLLQMYSGQEYMGLIYQLQNSGASAPFAVIGSYVALMTWLFENLFVVILVDMFIRCLIDSDVQILEEHVEQFQHTWRHGQCDPMGEFRGEPFTDAPEHSKLRLRKIQELVPQLLPSTEQTDVSWKEPTGLEIALEFFGIGQPPKSPLAHAPHRHKHSTPAMPFTIGMEAHVQGRLCEILEATWESTQSQERGELPSYVKVQFVESKTLAATSVLSPEGAVVPAVEGFTGLVDNVPCEITWVSRSREEVRVRYIECLKKRASKNNSSMSKERLISGGTSPRSPRVRAGVTSSDTASDASSDSGFESNDDQEESEQAALNEQQLIRVQAAIRGKLARRSIPNYVQQQASAKVGLETSEFHGYEEVLKIMRVTLDGDARWMNRLLLELGITQEEFVAGHRPVPTSHEFLDRHGRLAQGAVGLRVLPDGTYVQDIDVGFHELLIALSLMVCSYEGLTYEQQERKRATLLDRSLHYAARVMQTYARAKLAKRHLLRFVELRGTESNPGEPMRRWRKYHRRFGICDSYVEQRACAAMAVINVVRFVMLQSMKRCYAIKVGSSR
eukprot:SAG31_NODE_560_length_14088_cov_10.467010_1_plen_2416_part_00